MISDPYFDAFSTPKYQSRSRVQRALIRGFVSELHRLFYAAAPRGTVVEVGAGEGFVSGLLSERHPELRFVGIDTNARDLLRLGARFPRMETRLASAYDLGALKLQADTVIAAEVLEHLGEPERALDAMTTLGARHLIASVPHEPWFLLGNLARGKNLRRFGNDPEHVQHFSPTSFGRLLSRVGEVVTLERRLPWLLALVRLGGGTA